MGLFMTLEGLTEEDAVRLASEEAVPADRLRVFDLHCDTLDRLAFHGDASVPGGFAAHDARIPAHRMATLADNDAHVSLARTEGFAWCQCFAAFIPDEVRGDEAWALFRRVQSVLERELERCGDKLAQARTMAEVDAALAAGKTAAVLTVEGASFLEDDGQAESRLDALADAGVRMVTLTWNGPNALGSGNDTSHGLTGFGRSCVGELERRGIVVDVSHLNDAGFKDVCATARRPFAASHSNARAVCGHPRNLADWQLRELADCGGIAGLNFCTQFLTDRLADPTSSRSCQSARLRGCPFAASHSNARAVCGHPRNLADWQLRELADCGGIAGLNFCTQFLTDRLADPTRDDVLRHVDHVLETAGEDVLALGSDYDGCDVPSWLEPCDRIGALHELLACEFGRDIADKVFFRNARDFFERVESV